MATMEVSNSSLIELIDAWNLRDELLDEAVDDSKRRLELLRRAYRIIELHSPNNTFLEELAKELEDATLGG